MCCTCPWIRCPRPSLPFTAIHCHSMHLLSWSIMKHMCCTAHQMRSPSFKMLALIIRHWVHLLSIGFPGPTFFAVHSHCSSKLCFNNVCAADRYDTFAFIMHDGAQLLHTCLTRLPHVQHVSSGNSLRSMYVVQLGGVAAWDMPLKSTATCARPCVFHVAFHINFVFVNVMIFASILKTLH